MSEELILASGSATRRAMLENAGVIFRAQKPMVDEDAIKESLLSDQVKPRDLVDVLAEAKAQSISLMNPDAMVLGSDQILLGGSEIFSKPQTMEEARAHLSELSGRRHQLMSAAVLVRAGEAMWRHVDEVSLTMRKLSAADIDAYLVRVGDKALISVGSYQIESLGAQLFERIEGDYFTILGMPLLPLLHQLRIFGVGGM